jgi:hypothetical protein
MIGDHDDDRDSLWRVFKRKANRFGFDVAASKLETDATFIVFDDPFEWEGLAAAGRNVTVFEDAARMVSDRERRPWRGLSGTVRPEWVVVRSDRASIAAPHAAIDAKVNYFRWLPWDMSVAATGNQYDLAPEVWVLTVPDVGRPWLTLVEALFKGRRVRLFSEGVSEGTDLTAFGAFDVMNSVFAQKMVPEVVISFTDDGAFAPMKGWFIANGVGVREFAPYVVGDRPMSPAEALGLPRLSELGAAPDTWSPAEIIASAWVGSGWRRLTEILKGWCEVGVAA